MLRTTYLHLSEAILDATFHPEEKSRPGLETDEYEDQNYSCYSVEIFPLPDNTPLFEELSRLCKNIEKETGTPPPEDSVCRSLWIEFNFTLDVISSSTYLHSGNWCSSEFGNIHESFSETLLEMVIKAIRNAA